MSGDVEPITTPLAFHGEGPVWDVTTATLHWVDLLRGDLLSLDLSLDLSLGAADTEPSRRHLGGIAAAVRPRRGGGLVAAVDRGFALIGTDGQVERLPQLWADGGAVMNDGACDPLGRFYCGSTAIDGRTRTAALYRLDVDLTTHVVLSEVTVSNGLCWSPDGALAYYVDTPTRRIDVFDVDDDGGLVGRRAFARIAESDGLPDGLTVDAEGGVWLALWAGGAVVRFDTSGTLSERIDLPVTNPTACTFGGAHLDTLFITTSARDVVAEREAGSVFATRPGVGGTPAFDFAG